MAKFIGLQAKTGEAVWVNLDLVNYFVESPGGSIRILSTGQPAVEVKNTMNEILNAEVWPLGH